jgi:hypothetical protein
MDKRSIYVYKMDKRSTKLRRAGNYMAGVILYGFSQPLQVSPQTSASLRLVQFHYLAGGPSIACTLPQDVVDTDGLLRKGKPAEAGNRRFQSCWDGGGTSTELMRGNL